MDLHFIWKAVVIVFAGSLILRIAGRKSISQLTVAQTVLMVAVGSLIIQPVSDRNIWITMIITFLLVVTLVLIEYLALKFDGLERFFYSKSVLVVENGEIIEKNLKKLRLTIDMLEVRLRQQSVQRISDLQWATIESNGQLGYMLKPEKQPATKEDVDMLLAMIQADKPQVPPPPSATQSSASDELFSEVKQNKHQEEPPDRLK
ncbi:DUF421 domain-containing protein [Salsuginibacillus kocurii]|uniref:DUF421 domain-containing protein n=1 Tax=Salsuginibacillus kocurii TaxID=427078 RepID=UPI00037CA837|nr:DUF421 domain-containing protein [Salsuginibacillus kocurii]